MNLRNDHNEKPRTKRFRSANYRNKVLVGFPQGTDIKDRKLRMRSMKIELSPGHPDFGKVGFAELEDRVRQRAYQLYEKRGHAHGHALDDWLQAKAEVLGVTKGDSYLENMSAAA